MFNSISVLFYVIPFVYISTKVVRYCGGIIAARRFAANSPIPCVYVYNQRSSVVFWLLSPWFAPFLEALPWKMGHWIRYIKKDFAWHHKGDLHREELGTDVYWTIGPGGANLAVSNAELMTEICHRWKDFSKPVQAYQALNVFGGNIVSAEGAVWQRHRKITAPPFNERNSSLVFAESLDQGKAMLHSFTHDAGNNACLPGSEAIVEDLAHWTMTVALHVLSGAAFNLKMAWPTHSVLAPESSPVPSSSTQTNTKHQLSFQQSLDFLDVLSVVILFPKWVMRHSPFRGIRHILTCTEEFVVYIRELIASTEQNASKGDLLSAIVKAGKADEKMALSESETIGNMFLFIVAGHETTSNALQTALLMLACEPDIQRQVQQEIDTIWADKKDAQDWCYETDYPRMRTMMAVILETLRLFPPVVNFPKITNTTPQTLTYTPHSSSEPITLHLPPNTDVSLDVVSTHRNPAYYPSPHSFMPSRWLMSPSYIPPPNSESPSSAHANLFCPPKGAFVAFSAGFRACLGKKFALVELVGILGVLMKDASVELHREKGESWEGARTRALGVIDDRSTGLAMRMRGKVQVRFVRRRLEKGI